jgi:hypothetical protein
VLYNHGVDLEERTDDTNDIVAGATALHLAAYYGKVDALKILLSYGANINQTDINGQTPLHIAIAQGNVPIIKLLISAKANLFVRDKYGNTPIAYCRDSAENIIDILLAPTLNILLKLARGEFTKEEEKLTPDILQKNRNALKWIGITNPMDVAGVDGKSPLMEAVIHSNYDSVKLFLDFKANPTIENTFGLNSYVWAYHINNPRIKKLLGEPSQQIMQNVARYLDRLKNSSNKSAHDLMVLFVGAKPTGKLLEDDISNIHDRGEESILDFNEKKQIYDADDDDSVSVIEPFTKKEFQIANPNMQYLIWTAKIFTVNIIASGNTALDPQHVIALYLYTAGGAPVSQLIHGAHRELFRSYIKKLYEGLNMLPDYAGEIFIGTDKNIRGQFLIGNKINWSNLVSGTTRWNVALENTKNFEKNKQGTILLIKSKTAKRIHQYSANPNESEVVILPNTNFIVTNWYYLTVTCLGQANIRGHTYKVKADDMENTVTGNKGLIIELEQV